MSSTRSDAACNDHDQSPTGGGTPAGTPPPLGEVLEDWNPSAETLERWAYDVTLRLTSEDEHLVLSRVSHIEQLARFLDDPACPKSRQVARALTRYARELIRRQLASRDGNVDEHARRASKEELAQLRRLVAADQPSSTLRLNTWKAATARLLTYLEDLPRDRAAAIEVSRDLLDEELLASIDVVTALTDTGTTWEVSVPSTGQRTEHIGVRKHDGRIRIASHCLTAHDLDLLFEATGVRIDNTRVVTENRTGQPPTWGLYTRVEQDRCSGRLDGLISESYLRRLADDAQSNTGLDPKHIEAAIRAARRSTGASPT